MVHEPLSIQCYHGHYFFFFGVPIKSFCQNEIYYYGSQKDPELSRKYVAQIFLQELTT